MDIIREDCIYARQSVDRKDSISIESQIDFCKYELKRYSRIKRIAQHRRIFLITLKMIKARQRKIRCLISVL